MASIDFSKRNSPNVTIPPDLFKGSFQPGKPIDGQTREMIYNVYTQLQKNNPKETVRELFLKTSLCVGVSDRTVARILKEKRENGCFRTPGKTRPNCCGKRIRLLKYDQSVLSALRAKVNSHFRERENPSVKELLTEINNDKSIFKTPISRTTFHRLTLDMGIRFQRVKNRVILTDQLPQSQKQSPKLDASESSIIMLQSTDQLHQERSPKMNVSESSVIMLQSADQLHQEQSPKLDESKCSVTLLQSTDQLHQKQSPELDESESSVTLLQLTDQEQSSELNKFVIDSYKEDKSPNLTIPPDLFNGGFRPGKPINGYKREMIYNIYSCLQKDYPNETKTELTKKTSQYVGVSVRTVTKILQEKQENGCFQTPGQTRPNSSGKNIRLVKYGQSVLTTLRAKVNTYFLENKHPSVKGLLSEINNDKSIFKTTISRSTFNRLMRDMGIRFQKVKNGVIKLQPTDQSHQEQLPKLETSETHVIMLHPDSMSFHVMT